MAARYEPERFGLDVRQRVDGLREPDLVEHLERCGMDRVAAKVAVEVAMCLEQRHGHAGAREEQRQCHARWAGPDDATAGLMWLGQGCSAMIGFVSRQE